MAFLLPALTTVGSLVVGGAGFTGGMYLMNGLIEGGKELYHKIVDPEPEQKTAVPITHIPSAIAQDTFYKRPIYKMPGDPDIERFLNSSKQIAHRDQ
jgi:hypothetical protein